MPRSFLPLLLLCSIIAVIMYYKDPKSVMEFTRKTPEQSLPKTYLVNVKNLSYGENGALTQVLEANDIKYYPRKKYSIIEAPRFYSHDGNDQTWSVTSEQGRFLHKRELLTLQGNVVLTNDQNGSHLNTETMQINLRKKIATSNVAVTISQGINTMKSNGMIANMNKQTIRMMPDVESYYAPTAP